MRIFTKIAVIGTLATTACSAYATLSYGTPNVGQLYVGAKAGQITTNLTDAPKATTYGVYGGYQFNPNLGVEVEFQGSEKKMYNSANARLEYDVKSYGAYGTYRFSLDGTPFYAKGKIGASKTSVQDTNLDTQRTYHASPISFTGGVALGYAPLSNFGVEAGYSYLSGFRGGNKAMTLGVHLAF